jgi:hypothetical protein
LVQVLTCRISIEGVVHGCGSGQPVDGGEEDPAEHLNERQLRGVPGQELAEREFRLTSVHQTLREANSWAEFS